MTALRAFLARLGGFFGGRARRDHELAEELESHVQLHTDENIRRGMPPDAARREAILALGGLEATKDEVRDRASLPRLESLWQDLRFSVRTLRKAPLYTAIVMLTFAVGIGANAAIFGAVNAVLLKPLIYPDATRLVAVRTVDTRTATTRPVSGADFADFREGTRSFSAIAATTMAMFAHTGDGEPENIVGYSFAPDVFAVLGVGPVLGRAFDAADGEKVVVISDVLWRRRFHGDPAIVGRTMQLDGEAYRVLGVMPPGFQYPRSAELWVPYLIDAKTLGDRARAPVRPVARLAPGVSLEEARAELAGVAARLAKAYPDTNQYRSAEVTGFRDVESGDIRPLLLVLLAAVGFVLLLTCSNIAGLTLARGIARRRELAVRAALGAGRGRIVRQLLTESVLVALAGGALGLLLAWWGTMLLVDLFPRNVDNLDMPRIEHIAIDGKVVLFTFGAALLAGVLSGVVPALQTSRADLNQVLKEGARGSGRAGRLRPLLVTAQLGLAVVLMAGAGLLIRASVRQQRALGFEPDGVLAARLILDAKRYPDAARKRQLLDAVLARLRASAGVAQASAVDFLPLSGWSSSTEVRDPARPGSPPRESAYGIADPQYFATLRIPLVAGRSFTAADREGAPPVVIVDQRFVREILGGREAVGTRVDLGAPGKPEIHEIVGVIADSIHLPPPEGPEPILYAPAAQADAPVWGLVARTTGDPAALATTLRHAVWSVDPEQPVSYLMTLDAMVGDALAAQRMSTRLFSFFAALAVLLASLGLYGVLAHSVLERRHEIGIRMALGARRGHVLRLVLGRVALIAGAGIAVGIPAAWASGRIMGAVLHGVTGHDPAVLAAIVVLLVVIALGAAAVPLARAVRIEPMVALREE